jgi:hypothetical protein
MTETIHLWASATNTSENINYAADYNGALILSNMTSAGMNHYKNYIV